MTYALITDGAVAQYPYGFQHLRNDNPQVSFPSNPDDAKLAEFGVVRVSATDPPAHDPITQNVIEGTPVLINGQWSQVWTVEAATAEQLAERQRDADDAEADAEVRADAFVANFVQLTPTQVAAYVENNTATLAAMRAVLKKMALMLLVLAKRGLR
jgi:hypothetical protein